MEKLYIVKTTTTTTTTNKQTKQNKTNKQTKRSGADCCSDHELLIDKFRLKLKKVGKITRPFRCDLSQIPYTQ